MVPHISSFLHIPHTVRSNPILKALDSCRESFHHHSVSHCVLLHILEYIFPNCWDGCTSIAHVYLTGMRLFANTDKCEADKEI